MAFATALPAPQPGQIFVQLSAIAGGYITLPDSAFVHPADPAAKRHVPSLCFLISHPGIQSQSLSPIHALLPPTKPLHILFDLGLRQRAEDYLPQQQTHLENRRPHNLFPGVPETLKQNGIDLNDIDLVLLSHVHYDHHGDPEMFTKSKFMIGPGAMKVLKEGLSLELGSHQIFKPDLLPDDRTLELSNVRDGIADDAWKPLGPFDHTLDLLGDGSMYVINTPGHLPGHINLLCRLSQERWFCLAGDAFHDVRLLTGEREIGTWQDDVGRTCCIHLDREMAEQSIKRLRRLKDMGIGIIAAHDDGWAKANRDKFLPGHL